MTDHICAELSRTNDVQVDVVEVGLVLFAVDLTLVRAVVNSAWPSLRG